MRKYSIMLMLILFATIVTCAQGNKANEKNINGIFCQKDWNLYQCIIEFRSNGNFKEKYRRLEHRGYVNRSNGKWSLNQDTLKMKYKKTIDGKKKEIYMCYDSVSCILFRTVTKDNKQIIYEKCK